MGGIKSFLKNLKAWQLALILLPLLFIIATLLRFNHLHMTDLKTQLLEADKQGNASEIQSKLKELQEYTFSHVVINVVEKNGLQEIVFGTGPFYLEQSYIRDATAALQAAESTLTDENPNGNVFAAAMSVCKPQAIANGWAWNSEPYLNCMTGEINKYPADQTLTITAKLPSTALYRYDYASPVWTLSPEGILMIIAVLLILTIIVKIIIWLILLISLKILK
ncbi:hypothetical protein IJ096_02115 [Candidatus Saccharibacteria bacterium]|nr:hypothetical protein [Candidatus Saccharibacteria bacterium]